MGTGVINNRPDGLDDALHTRALAEGLLRYCPICDAYEVTDRRVAVIGTGEHGTREALFLRGYTADLTLISPGAGHDLDPKCIAELEAAGISRLDGPCGAMRSRMAAWRSTPPMDASPSTASTPRSARASAPNWPPRRGQ